jgi:Uma2 family endonuclease
MATTFALTLEEFLRRPETEPASEYVDGEVCQKTMPSFWHGVIQRLLSVAFSLYMRETNIGDAGPEIRCIFGPPGRKRAYVPDYIFVVAFPAGVGPGNGPYRGAPDLAVEILSRDDRPVRVRRKVRFYLAHGVRLVWLIDPERRIVTVFNPQEPSRIMTEGDLLGGGDVLPGFACLVRDILPPVDSSTPAGS